MEREIT